MENLLSSASKTFSPIGQIPMEFLRMGDLCRAAFLRYNDIVIEFKDGKKCEYRDWRIMSDPQTPDSRRTTCSGHMKFCLLLQFIEAKFPEMTRLQVLGEALDKTHTETRRVAMMSYNGMLDELVKMGVANHSPRVQSSAQSLVDIDL